MWPFKKPLPLQPYEIAVQELLDRGFTRYFEGTHRVSYQVTNLNGEVLLEVCSVGRRHFEANLTFDLKGQRIPYPSEQTLVKFRHAELRYHEDTRKAKIAELNTLAQNIT